MTQNPESIRDTGSLTIRFLAVGYDTLGGVEGRENKFLVSVKLAEGEIAEIEQRFMAYRPPGRYIQKWRRKQPVILGIVSGKRGEGLEKDFSQAGSGTYLHLRTRSSRGRRAITHSCQAQNELAEIIAEAVGRLEFDFQSDCTYDRDRYTLQRDPDKARWRRTCKILPAQPPRLRPVA